MKIHQLVRSLMFALPLVAATNAQAVLIDGTGDDFTINFSQTQGTNVLSATATFDVTSVTANQILINVSILNSSILTTFVNAGLGSFGLATDPTATSVSTSGASAFLGANTDDIPSLNFINLCIFAGNNCNGGPQNDLLAVGESDSFILTINGSFPDGLDVSNSGIKFQTSGGSFEFTGTICTSPTAPGCGPSQVPEPSTLLLIGSALVGLVARRRSMS